MRWIQTALVWAVVALAGALLTGCTSGSTATSTSTTGAATGALSPDGLVYYASYADSDGAGSTVILTGAIGDFGEAASVHTDGTINAEHNDETNLAGSGTGVYRGIRGSFVLTVTVDEIVPKSSGNATGAMLAQSVITMGGETFLFDRLHRAYSIL